MFFIIRETLLDLREKCNCNYVVVGEKLNQEQIFILFLK